MVQKFIRSSLLLLVLLAAAIAVPAVGAQSTDTVELVGTIQSMTANSITVNAQAVDISAAQINTALEIGAVVQVQGTLIAGGGIMAREVNAVQNGVQPGEVEITGTLESFSGTVMVVAGQTIDVTGAQIGAGVAVGQMVRVHAMVMAGNTWQAREVSLFVAPPSTGTPVPPGPVGEFEIVGTLDQIGNGFIVVSGQNINIAGAEIKNALLVGVLVKVHVTQVNGELVAREVENAVMAGDNSNANDNNTNANNNSNVNGNLNDNSNSNDNNDDNGNVNSNANDNTSSAAVSMDEAIAKVLAVYPNTTVVSIELTTKFGGTLVWEIKTANRVEVTIDATTGVILTIDQRGGSSSGSGGSNINNNDNRSDDNGNFNNNSNDNNDDHGGDRGGSDDSGSDDGMGGDGMG
ncbi:MAG: DUF5666 domain-containing protein [Anaerolineae bacterium]